MSLLPVLDGVQTFTLFISVPGFAAEPVFLDEIEFFSWEN